MIGRHTSSLRVAEGRRRRRSAANALLDLDVWMPRRRWLDAEPDRLLALGIDPRF
jgi:hypothetical protein